jgi:hypothetical protein
MPDKPGGRGSNSRRSKASKVVRRAIWRFVTRSPHVRGDGPGLKKKTLLMGGISTWKTWRILGINCEEFE